MLKRIPYPETCQKAEGLRLVFPRLCEERGQELASATLERDWERMVTFHNYPKDHWQYLRTTNPVESPFASLRLRMAAAEALQESELCVSGELEDADGGRKPIQAAECAGTDAGRL